MECPDRLRSQVPLAEHTTLGVGGPARWWWTCADEAEVARALAWARNRGEATFVLGGGSNLLVADAGFPGLVLRLADDAVALEPGGEHVLVRAGAGAEWDDLVALTVAEGLGGLECLSGIPGRVGGAPIQNIGAYGQEISETLASVRLLDRSTGEMRQVLAADCGFGYRHSHFKGRWRDRFVVTAATFRLTRRRQGTVRYGELERRLGTDADLEAVRRGVLEVRRSKSMVLDADDPNRRSAGSFFVNPVVDVETADEVAARARSAGVVRDLPRFDAGPGRVKLAAAWLIEQAGFERGHRRGAAGLSSRHTLALINRGGASADDLLALARDIRRQVHRVFGVTLVPEPVFLGFERTVDELLGP